MGIQALLAEEGGGSEVKATGWWQDLRQGGGKLNTGDQLKLNPAWNQSGGGSISSAHQLPHKVLCNLEPGLVELHLHVQKQTTTAAIGAETEKLDEHDEAEERRNHHWLS